MVIVPGGTTGRSEAVGTGTSPTLAEPTAAVPGDILFAFALGSSAAALTRPAGWLPLYVGTQGAIMWDVSFIQRGAATPGLTWVVSGSVYREVYVVNIKSVNPQLALRVSDLSAPAVQGTGIETQINVPPVRMTPASGLVLTGGCTNAGSIAGWIASAGYTIQTLNATQDDGIIESKQLFQAGIETPAAITGGISSSTDWWDGFTLVFTDEPISPGSFVNAPAFIKKLVPIQQRVFDA